MMTEPDKTCKCKDKCQQIAHSSNTELHVNQQIVFQANKSYTIKDHTRVNQNDILQKNQCIVMLTRGPLATYRKPKDSP